MYTFFFLYNKKGHTHCGGVAASLVNIIIFFFEFLFLFIYIYIF